MKISRLRYLVFVTLLLTAALAVNYIGDLRQEQAELLELVQDLNVIKDEKENLVEQLQEQVIHVEQLQQRNAQLEEVLINRARTYEIVTTGLQMAAPRDTDAQLLSRSGRQQITAVNMPVTQPSGFTAAALERAFAKIAPGMAGTGEAFVAAEKEYGINALVLAGICHLESGGGTSGYARNRNNLAGLGAYTSNPDNAFRFDSRADSIFFLAELLAVHYAPGGKFYGGSYDLKGIGVKYACDPAWAQKVAGRMEQIVRAAVDDPAALMAAAAQNVIGGET